MKIGLIARDDSRGLGHMTKAFYDNLKPDATLVVTVEKSVFPSHPEWYGDEALRIEWRPGWPFFVKDVDAIKDWICGVDVVYSAETFYDERFTGWARGIGTGTVLHAMPEFLRPTDQAPTALWVPTDWRLKAMSLPDWPAPMIAPVPVTLGTPAEGHDGPLRVLHVAGHRALGDRNGTIGFYRALREVTADVEVTVMTQDNRLPHAHHRSNITFRAVTNGVGLVDQIYEGQDVLVLPRRYGGLSLPLNEAAARGMALVMPSSEPHLSWPGVHVDGRLGEPLPCPSGLIGTFDVNAAGLAAAIDGLAFDRELLAAKQAESLGWAKRNSWEALTLFYRSAFRSVYARR